MMQKPISAAEMMPSAATPVRVVIVTLDRHLASTVERARDVLAPELPGLQLSLHAAAEWATDEEALARCEDDIANGDIIIATMLFLEDHVQAVLPALQARRDHCDAMAGMVSVGDVMKLTRLGKFSMDKPQRGPMALLSRLRGKNKKTGGSSGAKQAAMLRRIPKILRFIPGAAQDVRAYFLTMQYWLAGSDDNVINMVRFLIGRYADGERRQLREAIEIKAPTIYPDVGLYHPRMAGKFGEDLAKLPKVGRNGTVGVIVTRSYVLANDAGHYDGVIAALEAKGLNVIPAFSSGFDARPVVERFFMKNGSATVDAVISLTGFSLIGGPAYNDAKAAEELLASLDVPYLAAHALELQTLEQWRSSERGLMPVEATMMVAIPELDGATTPMIFGGRSGDPANGREMKVLQERADALAAKTAKLVALRRAEAAERKLAVVLFNFPPNGGATGTAAYLSVFESLFNTLNSLKSAGYRVEVPASVDALRDAVLEGNASLHGTDANVAARIGVDDHIRRERYLNEIEAQWGPAPGRQQCDGASIQVLGASFGNIFVGVQPAFGYEGDPMRLLFEGSFAPTHAFSAFYRWLREDFGAHAVLHYGTHGALEFMPGKQTGLSEACWPERLIGDLPNFYLYAANNPSEGTIAKRRSGATLITYMTPPVGHAGLYRGLQDLKASLDRYRALSPEAHDERAQLVELIQTQAAELELVQAEPTWNGHAELAIARLQQDVLELEYSLIPHGLHVVGAVPSIEERAELLQTIAEVAGHESPNKASMMALAQGQTPEDVSGSAGEERTIELFRKLATTAAMLAEDHESDALLHALDGRFVRPAPGGDLVRTPEVMPTGRNLHGFDPFKIPSAFAMKDGAAQAERLIERHLADGNPFPESIALVLWGTDNLKTEGGPIAQALALLGAKPRFDSYGRLAGATLIPLEELGRPRIDVVVTLSGIFRDLLPLQTKLLAEATFLAASVDEPLEHNFVRAHALTYQAAHDCDLETASLRVFSNAEGVYGSNVNQLIDSGAWQDEDELAETYSNRKCFAYGRTGKAQRQSELLQSVLADIHLAYQNLESVELGVTTVDHYFDTLGGIGRSVSRAQGKTVPIYIGDQTRGEGKFRTLGEQVALETRTRMLNPRWYEGMLKHGYEGVRQIEAGITNTMGWSATTGGVAPWVYQQLTQTYVLDETMRERLAKLNPKASAKVANRLLEAHERNYWSPDEAMLAALRRAGDELEDRLEGIIEGAPA